MIKLFDNGAYLLHGTELVEDNAEAGAVLASKLGSAPSKEEASKNTLAYGILAKHNTSDNMENLKIKFDQLDHSHCGRMYHSGITLCCVIHSKENIQYVQEAG